MKILEDPNQLPKDNEPRAEHRLITGIKSPVKKNLSKRKNNGTLHTVQIGEGISPSSTDPPITTDPPVITDPPIITPLNI
jgi:hypothetical protein